MQPVSGIGLSATSYIDDQCKPVAPGTANEYDYQRFLWALNRKDGVSVTQILKVVTAARYPAWNNGYQRGSQNNARDRLQAAAQAQGIGELWHREAEQYGVAH